MWFLAYSRHLVHDCYYYYYPKKGYSFPLFTCKSIKIFTPDTEFQGNEQASISQTNTVILSTCKVNSSIGTSGGSAKSQHSSGQIQSPVYFFNS